MMKSVRNLSGYVSFTVFLDGVLWWDISFLRFPDEEREEECLVVGRPEELCGPAGTSVLAGEATLPGTTAVGWASSRCRGKDLLSSPFGVLLNEACLSHLALPVPDNIWVIHSGFFAMLDPVANKILIILKQFRVESWACLTTTAITISTQSKLIRTEAFLLLILSPTAS